VAWPDIGRFAEAIILAQRELLAAAQDIRDEYGLGPRGTWILGMIATGRINTQADVVKRYKMGRSMIAEEMALLTKAGLVCCRPHESDRRQIALSVTELGAKANVRMGDAMAARMAERLDRYTLGDLLFCTGFLEDLARPA
jgi:DNA-binding MarR family transcriptional regulator